MDMTLEVIPLPVSDIDRARDFYRDKVGFHVDIDQEVMPGMRIVQLTPPGSGCSIALGESIWEMTPGPTPAPGAYQGLQLCVADIEKAHAEFVARGLEISEPVRYTDSDGATPIPSKCVKPAYRATRAVNGRPRVRPGARPPAHTGPTGARAARTHSMRGTRR